MRGNHNLHGCEANYELDISICLSYHELLAKPLICLTTRVGLVSESHDPKIAASAAMDG
jgi:hypothetical protein